MTKKEEQLASSRRMHFPLEQNNLVNSDIYVFSH
jgi:hypothetical protein